VAGLDVVTADYGVRRTAEKFGIADFRLFGSGFLFAMGGVYGVFASHTRQRAMYTHFALLSAVTIAVLLILTGDRGGLSAFMIAAGWAYTQRIGQIKRWYVVVGFIFALVVMPVIKDFRETQSVENEDRSVRSLVASTIYEMGMTLQVFCYTLEHIPRNKGYDWGVAFFSQTVNQIPNLGLNPGAYFGLDLLKHDPSHWLTSTANPSKYHYQAGGYGYALGAQWYFDFGLTGVFLGMTLTGWFLGWVRNVSRRSPMMLTFSALLLGMFALVIRNDLGYPLRTLLWPMMGLLLLRLLWPRTRPMPQLMREGDLTHRVGAST
jgi:oligosaccharide repeat unit polymerase